MSGATVFPTAVAAAASAVSLIGRLTVNAAIAIAGHSLRPKRRSPTTAMPDGGQRGVILRSISASFRLSSAASQ